MKHDIACLHWSRHLPNEFSGSHYVAFHTSSFTSSLLSMFPDLIEIFKILFTCIKCNEQAFLWKFQCTFLLQTYNLLGRHEDMILRISARLFRGRLDPKPWRGLFYENYTKPQCSPNPMSFIILFLICFWL